MMETLTHETQKSGVDWSLHSRVGAGTKLMSSGFKSSRFWFPVFCAGFVFSPCVFVSKVRAVFSQVEAQLKIQCLCQDRPCKVSLGLTDSIWVPSPFQRQSLWPGEWVLWFKRPESTEPSLEEEQVENTPPYALGIWLKNIGCSSKRVLFLESWMNTKFQNENRNQAYFLMAFSPCPQSYLLALCHSHLLITCQQNHVIQQNHALLRWKPDLVLMLPSLLSCMEFDSFGGMGIHSY